MMMEAAGLSEFSVHT